MITVSSTTTSILRRAAVRATLAASVHDTQPWRLHLGTERLDVWADRTRQLPALDPSSRQMTMSVGCAVFNARVSAAADGLALETRYLPDRHQLDLMVALVPTDNPPDSRLAGLDPYLELRQTSRRHFRDEPVPDDVLDELRAAVAAEGANLVAVREPAKRRLVVGLTGQAGEIQALNPAFLAEQRAWAMEDPERADGFAADGGAEPEHQSLVVLGTDSDGPEDWLRAGEALERMLLVLSREGFAARPYSQVAEVPVTRTGLRAECETAGYPHVVVRIGRAPVTAGARRRRLVDVLVEEI